MKKLIYLFLIVILSGCHEEFLTEEFYSELGSNTFPRSEKQAELAVNAAYHRMEYILWGTKYIASAQMPTPQTMYKSRELSGDDVWVYDVFAFDANHEKTWFLWRDHFKAVRSCNDAIEQVPNAPLNEETMNRYIAEAKFIRALCYFNLVRLFGEVPIIDEAQTLQDDIYKSRSSLEEVYEFIISDLTSAAEDLPTRTDYIEMGIPLGRASKYAAIGLLSKVYLTMAGYPLNDLSKLQLAQSFSEEVMNSNDEHFLLPSYPDVFDWKNDNNEEILFAFQYEGIRHGEPWAHHMFLPPFTNQWSYKTQAGWVGYFAVEPEFALYYLDHSIVGGDTSIRAKHNLILEWTDTKGNNWNFLGGPGSRAYSGKWRAADFSEMNLMQRLPNDYPYLRFADILLINSEAINELEGPTEQALRGINMVRERAGLPLYNTSMTQEELREAIFIERDLELCFESHVLYDYRRRGYEVYKDTMENYYNPELGYQPDNFSITMEPRHMLYPIPAGEVKSNPNLQQNTGY